MKNRRLKVYPTSLLIRSFVFIFFTVFSWRYSIRKRMPKEVRKLSPPYLVLGNHIGFWDPFVTGNFLPHFVHFVSSDAAFRNPVFRFFLTRLGTIPKKKNIRDTKVIRDIIAVIRQGENVGIFPEAVRNWAGRSFPIDPSIAKLIKLLKVPVVVPVLKGMNLFNPRWAVRLRHTSVSVEYSLLFTPEVLSTMTVEDISHQLASALFHDEVEYQRHAMVPLRSNHRAEYISHALYVCPQCHAIDSFRCRGNDFHCVNCGYDVHIDRYGFFERRTNGRLFYDNIRDWYDWQERYLVDLVAQRIDSGDQNPIFTDVHSKVYHGKTSDEMVFIDEADVSFYCDRVVFQFNNRPELEMDFDKLQTINPQVREKLEIFYDGEAYRVIGARSGVSSLKWEVAANVVWKKSGQTGKLSPYIHT